MYFLLVFNPATKNWVKFSMGQRAIYFTTLEKANNFGVELQLAKNEWLVAYDTNLLVDPS